MANTSLVTGGAGFIGTHVVLHLIKAGHSVIILDDLSGGVKENVNPKAKLYIGSITDSTLVNQIFIDHQITYVYHLAAYAAEGLSHFIRRFNYENNLIGSINLINTAVNHAVKCFVFTSSIAVYGTNQLPMIESNQPKPEDPYGIAKFAVELDLLNAYKMFGLNYIIFRPHNVYGSHQNIGDKYRNVIGIFMNQILKKEALTIYGDGNQSRAFSYIDDVAPYIAKSVDLEKARNQIFNIGSDKVFTLNELAKIVLDVMNADLEIDHLKSREEVKHAFADHEKFESVFDPDEYKSLEEGIKKMAQWVIINGSKSSRPFENVEIKKNLPENWK